MRFFSTGALGSSQSTTPEGFLVCQDVPIASLGEMLYAGHEVPLDAGRDGLVRVTRDEDQLFSPITMASFEGKPVTMDHPDEDVTPANWKKYAVGVVQNVHRGQGDKRDYLMADLLITDASAIALVKNREVGKSEVSCGYDADYEQSAPGRGRQQNIIGNHVALVERGRCGPRCAIGDSVMAKKQSFKDRIRAAFMARDAEGVEEALKEAPEGSQDDVPVTSAGGGTHVHVHLGAKEPTGDDAEGSEAPVGNEAPADKAGADDVERRLDAIETALADLAEVVASLKGEQGSGEVLGDGEAPEKLEKPEAEETVLGDAAPEDIGEESTSDRKKTGDTATLSSEARTTFARAEALLPGTKFPVVDGKNPVKMRDALCAFRKKVLLGAYKHGGTGKDAIDAVLGGARVDLRGATCDSVATLFNGAAEIAKRSARAPSGSAARNTGSPIKSPAELNAANKAFWAGKNK